MPVQFDKVPAFARTNILKSIIPLWPSANVPEYVYEKQEVKDNATVQEANLITSEVSKDVHIPLIDLDLPAALLPSSTAGHWHLYLGKQMSKANLTRLITTMVEVGLVQKGVLQGLEDRGFLSLRLPGVTKDETDKQAQAWQAKNPPPDLGEW